MFSPAELGPDGPNFCRRVPATARLGYGRWAVSRPAPNFTHSLCPDVESISPVRRFLVLRPFPSAGDGTMAFSYFSGQHEESRYRHAAFMAFFYDLYALVGTSGSRRSVSRPHEWSERLLSAFPPVCVVTTAPRRAFGPRVIRTRIRPLAGAECAPNSNRGREAGPSANGVSLPCPGRTQACHAHLASAENRSPETGRTERMAAWTLRPVSEGHLTGVGRPV